MKKNEIKTFASVMVFDMIGETLSLLHMQELQNVMHLSMLSCWGGGRAKAGDLNTDHLFSSNAQPQGN